MEFLQIKFEVIIIFPAQFNVINQLYKKLFIVLLRRFFYLNIYFFY